MFDKPYLEADPTRELNMSSLGIVAAKQNVKILSKYSALRWWHSDMLFLG